MNNPVRVMVGLVLMLPLIAAPTTIRAQTAENAVTSDISTPFKCGSTYNGVAVTCTSSTGTGVSPTPTRAPEIDMGLATSGLVFVLGCLAILRGRKRSSSQRNE